MKIPKIKMPRFKMPAKKWIVFSIVSASSAVLALVCLVLFSSSGKSLRSQQAASVWTGDSGQKYAQISVFAPSDGGLDTGKIMGFRQKVTEATADTTAKKSSSPQFYDTYLLQLSRRFFWSDQMLLLSSNLC